MSSYYRPCMRAGRFCCACTLVTQIMLDHCLLRLVQMPQLQPRAARARLTIHVTLHSTMWPLSPIFAALVPFYRRPSSCVPGARSCLGYSAAHRGAIGYRSAAPHPQRCWLRRMPHPLAAAIECAVFILPEARCHSGIQYPSRARRESARIGNSDGPKNAAGPDRHYFKN